MPRALGVGMHTVTFEMKHAHLSAERFAREEAAGVGLTPARLDMLRTIMDGGSQILQSTLRQHLCVSAP